MAVSWLHTLCAVSAVLFLLAAFQQTHHTVSAPLPAAKDAHDDRARSSSGLLPDSRRSLQELPAVNRGNNGPYPLGLCEGDCDVDEHCEGDLVCHLRDSGDDAPGCYLDGRRRNSRTDFCIRKDSYGGGGGGGDGGSGGDGGGSGGGDGGGSGGGSGGSSGQETFALKLYWQPGYYWQEQTFERRWCMRCRRGCRPYRQLRIVDCDRVRPTKWRFVYYDNDAHEAQIRVHDRPLCMEVDTRENAIFLAPCNPFEQNQRFISQGGNFNSYRFEIVPKTKRGWCLTQRHHPKADEIIVIEPCIPTRLQSDTSYWNKY